MEMRDDGDILTTPNDGHGHTPSGEAGARQRKPLPSDPSAAPCAVNEEADLPPALPAPAP